MTPAAAADRLVAGCGAGAEHGPLGAVVGLRAGGAREIAAAGNRVPAVGAVAAEPATTDTRFDVASVTKAVATTTALIRLVSDRSVGLDDRAAHYLPGFAGGGKDRITLRHLLLHRAGLWEWQPLYAAAPGDPAAAAALAESLPLRHPPDTGRHYSDLGFMLLGRVIEAVTGADLNDAVSGLVTGPLSLHATGFRPPPGAPVAASAFGDAAERRMVATGDPYPVVVGTGGFDGWRDALVVGDANDGKAFHAFAGVSGHAGLFSTVGDMLTWASVLADASAHDDLWDPRIVAEFTAPGPDAGQALGFRRYARVIDGTPEVVVGHPGFTGCAVGFVPDRGVALALGTNRLVTRAAPVATDALWSEVLTAADTVPVHGRPARG
ncbi:CubicO group peptidase (beta-lactamase class C family) [Murinocardiopsis flavida]|uniref:CubicO group peptidase (Beta-lactamase class C family) n=1 Tax=Murinocardiopsis flavida TaxID=645275 RepID=A0A2P8DRQ2_9ACTN|nr:serine hydrolase domain-containing protein [Murinocardiopsis flavida]PSK99896.1 CubicO group peptidase (beta-lactamase class C family) [Murinocardiopsis flavida]